MSTASIFAVLQQIAQTIPGCRLTSVVDAETGMAIASVSAEGVGSAAAGADAYHADMYRFVGRAMDALGAPQDVESLVLVGDYSVFISLPFNERYFWHVVTTRETTVGYTQAMMRRYSVQVAESVRGLVV
ncbi:MAG: hypothetical protein AAGI01_17885 [Myxococcota bacterium]